MSEASDPRIYRPHVPRNRGVILEVLRRVLPQRGLVLEVASGSGEHAVHFARGLPSIMWQPTDYDAASLASIAAHRESADTPNLLAPAVLDASSERWPVESADALVCINMIHISPWSVSEGLMAGAGRVLSGGGVIYLYGPYRVDGRHTAASNEEFDVRLRTQNPQWGVRDVADVAALAARHDFALTETVPMAANNFSLVFQRNA
jgi:SAM-dependent methyltransferase